MADRRINRRKRHKTSGYSVTRTRRLKGDDDSGAKVEPAQSPHTDPLPPPEIPAFGGDTERPASIKSTETAPIAPPPPSSESDPLSATPPASAPRPEFSALTGSAKEPQGTETEPDPGDLMPWDRDAADTGEVETQSPLFEFTSRDSRKPQLSATVSEPLTDLQRRRNSGGRPAAQVPADQLPKFLRKKGDKQAPQRRQSGPQAVQKLRASDAWYGEDEAAAAESVDVVAALDLRWLLGAALLAALAAYAMPVGAGAADAPLWRAALTSIPVAWPLGLTIAAVALGAALLGGAAVWWGGLLRNEPEGPLLSRVVLGTALVALVALLFRGASDPDLMRSVMAPMRHGLFGLPLPAWNALAAAGLFAIGQSSNQRVARMIAGLGVLAMLIAFWMPIGWIGATRLPISAALHTWTASDPAIDGAMVTAPLVAAPGWVLLQALLSVALAALLAVPHQFSPWALRGAAGLTLLAGAATPLVASEAAVGVALGAAALNLALGLLLIVLLAGLIGRMAHAVDDEVIGGFEAFAVMGVLLCYFVLKTNGMRYSSTDEGIYFYAARAWAEGIWPYHDFFFSHPPLHIAVPAALFALFGYSFTLAKSVSAVAVAISGLLVWRLGRRYLDPFVGVFAMGLFMLAAEVLKASTNLTGINLTTMWVMLGLWLLMKRKDFLAGMILGAAACTGIYAAAAVLAMTILTAFAPRTEGTRVRRMYPRVMSLPVVQVILGFVIVFGTINLLGYLLAGDSFADGVYRYHFLKRAKVAGFIPMSEGLHAIPNNALVLLGSRDFNVSLYYHAAQYWLALLAPLTVAMAVVLRRFRRAQLGAMPPDRGPLRTPSGFAAPDVLDDGAWDLLWHPRRWWLHRGSGGFTMIVFFIAISLLLEFAQFKERYDFYYALILPFLALLSAATIHAILRVGRTAIGCGWAWRHDTHDLSSEGRPVPVPGWLRALAVALLVIAFAWVPLNMWANHRAFPSEFSKRPNSAGAGERLQFEWLEPPGGEAISALTWHFFWKPYRLRGNVEASVHHYLWSKKRWFSTAEDIAAYIRANSDRSDTITGSSTHAPIVALLADRRMAGDHVDTNAKTFKTGMITPEEFWSRVCQDKLKFIVAGPRSWFSPRYMNRKPTVMKHFRLVREFDDPHLKHWRSVRLQLWQRIEQTGGHPSACAWVPRVPR